MADTVILNEDGSYAGVLEFKEAIKSGAIRADARVFVFNFEGELLLQKRSGKVMFPHTESESASGHVDPGETYLETAQRELKEELGIETELHLVAEHYRDDTAMGSVYKAKINSDSTEINFDHQ